MGKVDDGGTMIYGSVCSGIEAASVSWRPLGWKAAFYSEIDPYCCRLLKHHYPETKLYGDFTQIGTEAGPIDVLVGGTPCQSFSIAGLRGGLGDERGNLALEYLRLADRLRPRWLVWENVPGVLSSITHEDPYSRPPEIDLDSSNGPADGEEVVVEDEYDTNEVHAFSCFLAGLSELGYGFSYRILNAEFFGVPQRRRRVFVVGHLGDWRRAAAVLFERQSMSGNPAPSRKKGKETAIHTGQGVDERGYEISPALTSSGRGVERTGESRGQDCVIPVAAFSETGQGWFTDLGDCAGTVRDASQGGGSHATLIASTGDTSHCLNAGGMGRIDYETETLIAHACREDATIGGRMRGQDDSCADNLIAFDTTQVTSKSTRSNPKPGGPCHPLGAGSHPPTIVFRASGQEGFTPSEISPPLTCTDGGGTVPTVVGFQSSQSGIREVDSHATLDANNGSRRHNGVIQGLQVRRLTPMECERLQGFPDNYTAIEVNGKVAADGPRYKALGNSMAVPVMRWIGERIQMVEEITATLDMKIAA